MTIVYDISLQFLKWRFKTNPGAKRAYDWIQEDIESMGWHRWLTAKDSVLMASRERLTSSLFVYANKRHSLFFLARLSKRRV